MQLFPIGKVYDFMSQRRLFVGVSLLLMLVSIVLMFKPGPRLGTDFVGGTEVEVAFKTAVNAGQVRAAVQAADFSAPDVIRVQDEINAHRYLIRVQEVSTIDEAQQREIEKRLCYGEGKPAGCAHYATEVKFSPGGEKITIRYEGEPDLNWIAAQMEGLDGIRLRTGVNNPTIQNARENRVEIALMSRGDQLMDGLRAKMPEGSVPDAALRTEWIGPKAGAQLRDAAIKSILIALVFIMAYVAFRFDLRFAPGGVLALTHDALVTVGILTLLGRELNLTTVAAVLTIIGYSVNDTVVVYDRVRENLGKLRGSSFQHLINVSISEMLSRTVLTSGTTIMVLVCFFIWGTGTLRDFALTLIIGMVLGTFSSVYVALPLTDWLDRKFFSQVKGAPKRA
jgi:preprotein translocase subunit SecF